MGEQYTVAVPNDKRVDGYLYDADSGVLLSVASDEIRARKQPNVPFTMNIAGCPHKVVIHKAVP